MEYDLSSDAHRDRGFSIPGVKLLLKCLGFCYFFLL